MSDDAIVEEVTEPAGTPENPEPLPPVEVRPPWVDEIITAVTAIPDAIANSVPNPAAPEVELPGDGETVSDESPVSKPWTHKTPFGH